MLLGGNFRCSLVEFFAGKAQVENRKSQQVCRAVTAAIAGAQAAGGEIRSWEQLQGGYPAAFQVDRQRGEPESNRLRQRKEIIDMPVALSRGMQMPSQAGLQTARTESAANVDVLAWLKGEASQLSYLRCAGSCQVQMEGVGAGCGG